MTRPRPALTLALIQEAAAGRPGAAHDLCLALRPDIRRSAARLLRFSAATRVDVDDVVDEVLLSLLQDGWKSLLAWDLQRGPLDAYAHVLVKRGVIDVLRLKRHRGEAGAASGEPELERLPDSAPDPEAWSQAAQRVGAVSAALERRSAYYFRLFHWFHVEGLDNDEVCVLTGRTPARVADDKLKMHRLVKAIVADLDGE
jgi:DNA-directed RNA polymerase specialized sigma24 family protein